MITRVVPIADMHSGLVLSPMPEKWKIGNNTILPNKTQEWINDLFWKAHERVFDGSADEVVIFLMGDEIHGTNGHFETWAPTWKMQADAFINLLLPWVNKASGTYSIRGSEYHVGEDGSIEEYIAQELGVYKRQTFPRLKIKIQDIEFRISHKGPKPGSRFWTRPNAMALTLRDKYMTTLGAGMEPSDIYLWGHFHEYLSGFLECDGPWGTKVVSGYVVPAWCTPNEYALTRVDRIETADVGLVFFDVEGPVATPHKLFKRIEATPKVVHNG